jgi:23S rRNA (uracil1939-C5)-methyltransferase
MKDYKVQNITITGINDFGQTYGKLTTTDKRIFVDKAVIGDEIEVKIIKENNKFIKGEISKINNPSLYRIDSPCKFFESCGGCNFLNFEEQYYQKTKQEILSRILLNNCIFIDENSLSEKINFVWLGKKSRRRAVFHISKENLLGFFVSSTHNLVNIDSCLVVEKEISALIPRLQKQLLEIEQNLFSSATVTLFDDGLDLTLIASKKLNSKVIFQLSKFATDFNINISYKIENKLISIYKASKNQVHLKNFSLDLTANAFIQASKQGLNIISKQIIDFIKSKNLNGQKIRKITDLYAGFGFYSFAILDELNEEIEEINLYELNRQMVDLINKNSLTYNLKDKIKPYIKDLDKNPLNETWLNKSDLAIINPPRSGAENQIKRIANSKLKNLIMVSCNPISFALDSKVLIESGFIINSMVAIDQFYSTANFEIVATFTRNANLG